MRRFTNQEIPAAMEMMKMGIGVKRIAREYQCEPSQIQSAMDYARKHGMERKPRPELADQPPRMVRGRT